MHLADAFIQSDLHCIQVTVFFTFLSALAFPGNRTHDLGVASAMLYHLSYRKASYIYICINILCPLHICVCVCVYTYYIYIYVCDLISLRSTANVPLPDWLEGRKILRKFLYECVHKWMDSTDQKLATIFFVLNAFPYRFRSVMVWMIVTYIAMAGLLCRVWILWKFETLQGKIMSESVQFQPGQPAK